MNTIHFNILTPVPARDQLNSTNSTENISTAELVPSNRKPKKVISVNAERPILYVMILLSVSPSLAKEEPTLKRGKQGIKNCNGSYTFLQFL